MPLLVLIVVMSVAAVMAGFLVRRAPRLALEVSIAALVLVAGAIAAAALTVSGPLGIDTSIADWGHAHATTTSHDVMRGLSFIGQPGTIIALAVVLALVETARTRNLWTILFLAVVVGGNGLLTTLVKNLVDRVRPDLDPTAASLGPSFPSGHSSWSAAFFAAAALLLAYGHSSRVRGVLAGAAAALAVAIATSRVLLPVHWLSDVAVGLTLGWAWFAACALALGPRLGARRAPRSARRRSAPLRGASDGA